MFPGSRDDCDLCSHWKATNQNKRSARSWDLAHICRCKLWFWMISWNPFILELKSHLQFLSQVGGCHQYRTMGILVGCTCASPKVLFWSFLHRGLFIIDDKGILRQITINDLPVGRSIDETLRLVQAFQFTDKHGEGEWWWCNEWMILVINMINTNRY